VHIVMKTASKGIITGILLALARVAGETAPLAPETIGALRAHRWDRAAPPR